MTRPTKRSIAPATRAPRPTQRGVVAQTEPEEPSFSSRPTRRDLTSMPPPTTKEPLQRGQYSIAAARGIPADVVSGTIEGRKRRSTRTKAPVPIDNVALVSATKKQIVVVIHGQEITMERQAAIQLASLIFTTFGVSDAD